MIGFNQVQGMNLVHWFPDVVTFRVSLSFNEVLELSRLALASVVQYSLHFIFFFSVDKIR